jgi:hypothetical protein
MKSILLDFAMSPMVAVDNISPHVQVVLPMHGLLVHSSLAN